MQSTRSYSHSFLPRLLRFYFTSPYATVASTSEALITTYWLPSSPVKSAPAYLE